MNELPGWRLIGPRAKQRQRILPFLTFPLLKACNLRCCYCGVGGELSASLRSQWEADEVIERSRRAVALGVRKIRLTGGEPFLFRGIERVLAALNQLGVYTHVNTNGCYIVERADFLSTLGPTLRFAVSLDSLDRGRFDAMTGRAGFHDKVLAGINALRGMGLLLRINMVVTTENAAEIPAMIAFCREQGCALKLLDVVSVPLPYGKRQDLHVDLTEVERELMRRGERVWQHEYARAFGTPCRIYSVDGVAVTVKNTWNGSRYDVAGICKSCEYFPCHEGLYDIFALPDGRIAGCRWSDASVASPNGDAYRAGTIEEFEAGLLEMAAVFQRAGWRARRVNPAMRPYPQFVMRSLKAAERGS